MQNSSPATRSPGLRTPPWLQSLFIRLVAVGSAVWLCVFPVVFLLAGLLLLVGTGQGRELLDWTLHARQRASHAYFFHAAVLVWAAATWYSSRLLLERRTRPPFTNACLASEEPYAVRIRKWMPRLLGAAVYPPLAGYFLLSGMAFHAAVVAAVGLAWWTFMVKRRSLLRLPIKPGEQREKLGPVTLSVVSLALLALNGLLLAFLYSEVALPRWIGAGPIVLLALSCWTLVGSIVFVLLPKSYGLPSLALAPVLLLVAAGWVDNHEVRRLPREAERVAGIERSALQWLEAREAPLRHFAATGRPVPVYIVAAEGGGLRAAYWTASVLGTLQDATRGRFSQHLFAASGVSGGSLGAAAFVAETARPETSCEATVTRCLQRFLAHDFLSPAMAYLLFPDGVQRVLPWPVRSFDRARAIELAWERSWAETHAGSDAFAQPFETAGAPPPDAPQTARLFLNATRVETGRRVLVSAVRVNDGEMPEVEDLLAVGDGWSMPLSTAVHLSARFTYVSPAGKICRDGQDTCGHATTWGRVVDGGYHENSGAQTAQSLLRVFRRTATKFRESRPGLPRIAVHAVIVTNDPASSWLCGAKSPATVRRFASELRSPIDAFLNSRPARGSQARRGLADAAAGYRSDALEIDCQGDALRENTIEFSLAGALEELQQPERPIALGWLLAEGSRQRMAQGLCTPRHQAAVQAVQEALGLGKDYGCRAE